MIPLPSRAPADNEEDASEKCVRYEMKDGQQWSRHGPDDSQAHDKVRYALLCHAFGDDLLPTYLCPVLRLNDFQLAFVMCQSISMYRRLPSRQQRLQNAVPKSYLWRIKGDTKNVTRSFKLKHGIELLVHPAQSPGLNPQEPVWNILKQRVRLYK